MLKQKQNKEIIEGMREVFVSYHMTTLDMKYNGFGNYVGQFNTEVYANQSMAKFIEDLEKSIKMANEAQLNTPVQVKVLYFR